MVPELVARDVTVEPIPGPRLRTPQPGAPAVTFDGWPRRWNRLLVTLGVIGGLVLLNDLYVFESVVIPTSSMEPAILPHEHAILSHLSRGIHRFDVVVIESPKFGVRMAKRVIALPGERVRLEDSWKVFVNDTPLDYSAETAEHQRREAGNHLIHLVPGSAGPFETRFARRDLRLGPNEYFVLGDNRLASDDSRSFGPVTRADIQGTLSAVWYSYDPVNRRLRTERMLRSVR